MRMSKDASAPSGKLDTYIGEDTSIEGAVKSSKSLTIYGRIKGAIECQGRVVIGQSGNVEADIIADNVIISGKVVGNITARGKLEMSSTGIVQGDVKTARLIMDDGGKFDGRCEMLSDGSAKEDAPHALPAKENPKLPDQSRKKEEAKS